MPFLFTSARNVVIANTESSSATGAEDFKSLAVRYPLPSGWSGIAVVEDTFIADGIKLRRAGLSSVSPAGEEILGSAADAQGSPMARAYFELVERVSTIEWLGRDRAPCDLLTVDGRLAKESPWEEVFPESPEPAAWRYSRSNGIAIHGNWERASKRAFYELCERDRVLRSWYGETVPQRVLFDLRATPLAHSRSYEWCAYSFPESEKRRFSRGVHVRGVFGIPRNRELPFVFGYGARSSPEDALFAATREATQLLAFLWGESLPEEDPASAPIPAYHLEAFQWSERRDGIRRWLNGGHARYRSVSWPPGEVDGRVFFVDLTPSWVQGLRVSKAVCAEALPLAFGNDPGALHLPAEIRVHPLA
jgi:hypothetical protein